MSLFTKPKIPDPPKLDKARQNRKAADAARRERLDRSRGVSRQTTILGSGISPLGPTPSGNTSQVSRQTTLG